MNKHKILAACHFVAIYMKLCKIQKRYNQKVQKQESEFSRSNKIKNLNRKVLICFSCDFLWQTVIWCKLICRKKCQRVRNNLLLLVQTLGQLSPYTEDQTGAGSRLRVPVDRVWWFSWPVFSQFKTFSWVRVPACERLRQ